MRDVIILVNYKIPKISLKIHMVELVLFPPVKTVIYTFFD